MKTPELGFPDTEDLYQTAIEVGDSPLKPNNYEDLLHH